MPSMNNTNTALKAPIAPKTATAKKVAGPPAKKVPAKQAAPAPKTTPAKKVTETKPVELPYNFDLYRSLKVKGTEALHAVLYDARLKTPKGSKTPEEAAAKANALITAFGEWVRLAEQSARPLLKD